jgi:hypothetical protein
MRQGHRTLPIPQVNPPAESRSDPQPGNEVSPELQPKPPGKNFTRKDALRTPRYTRMQNERGISGAMDHAARNDMIPTVPLPVRSSLAQEIGVWKVQLSKYLYPIAAVTRWPGMPGTSYSKSGYPSFAGYPTAKVQSIINTAPRMGGARAGTGMSRPGFGGYPKRSGFMTAPRRFKKALPLPLNDYEPPVYGE